MNRRAFSLIEVVLAGAMMMVLASGALAYQYYSTTDVKKAEVKEAASHLALTLVESWKGQNGTSSFNPIAEFEDRLTIKSGHSGPPVSRLEEENFTLLGYYTVVSEGVTYFVTLSYRPENGTTPTMLCACTAWRKDYAAGDITPKDASVRITTYMDSTAY